jgi:4-alpha-glucanotransferase
VATNSTHDTDTTAQWYDALPAAERANLLKLPSLQGLDAGQSFNEQIRDALLRLQYASPSGLVLVTFQDAMGTRERINQPGTVAEENWSYRIPASVKDLAADQGNTERLRKLAEDTHRTND